MDRRLVVGTAMIAMTAIGVLGFTVLTDDNAESSTPCSSFVLNGTVESNICGDVSASWIVGTSIASTIAPTTTTIPNTSTTKLASTTTLPLVTTTTVPGELLACVAYAVPTNTFTLNNTYGDPGQINSSTPIFTLAGDGAGAGIQYTVQIDSTVLPGTYGVYPRTSSVCIQSPALPDGQHTISAVELSPNSQQVFPYKFLVDTTPPGPPVITASSYSGGFIRLSGTCISTFSIRISGGGGASCGSTGLWSAATSRPSGTRTLYTKQTDKAGNDSVASNIVTVVVP